MNDEAVYRTAPATPGLLITNRNSLAVVALINCQEVMAAR